MKIFLVGMPASGKSILAQKLALSIKLNFIDTDTYIETETNKTVSEIFKSLGEKEFRKLENIAIKNIIKKSNIVVATGGGLPCFSSNMEIMLNSGIVIYLQTSINTLYNRIKNDKNNRPLINTKSEIEIKEYLKETLKTRKTYYEQATFIISTEKKIDEQVAIINSLINNF